MRWKGLWGNHIVRTSNVDIPAFEVFLFIDFSQFHGTEESILIHLSHEL